MGLWSGRCHSTVRLEGKTAVVTGCNSGIGKETVKDFYKRGARVIMACRSLERAEEAKTDIENSCKDLQDLGKLVIVRCDLSSLTSVRECAQHLLDTEPHINILVNNAGIMACPKSETKEGFEMQFGTNHLGPFLLTLLLLPRIKNSTPARIVTISSMLHTNGSIDFEDINYKTRSYSPVKAYCHSKLANILFSRELAKKLKEHNIENINTYSLHPGMIKSDLVRNLDDSYFGGARVIFKYLTAPFAKSPELGAQTTIYCSVDEKCANETGLYYSDCAVTSPSRSAQNDDIARKLWDESIKLVGLEGQDPLTAQDSGVKI